MELNLPLHPLQITDKKGKKHLFDEFRKKHVVITPEELVRQQFLHYLVNEFKYPKSLIEVEKGLTYNALKKRADAVVYNLHGLPTVLIEFKSPKVEINQQTFEQIALYNLKFKVPYLFVSNGLNHYCCKINFETKQFKFLPAIPSYKSII